MTSSRVKFKMGGLIFDMMKKGGVILDLWKSRWGNFRLMERGGVILEFWRNLGYKMGDSYG